MQSGGSAGQHRCLWCYKTIQLDVCDFFSAFSHLHVDTAYVLSYAVIMLHTSIYNPSVKDKPTVDRFVSMNRGINNGADLPREFLVVSFNTVMAVANSSMHLMLEVVHNYVYMWKHNLCALSMTIHFVAKLTCIYSCDLVKLLS